VKQAKLIGVLYLENNLASHVFTPSRISVLELLASQAAISLENARLYSDLQEREARIRRLVDSDVIGIIMWILTVAFSTPTKPFSRWWIQPRRSRFGWPPLDCLTPLNGLHSGTGSGRAHGDRKPQSLREGVLSQGRQPRPVLLAGATFDDPETKASPSCSI